MARVFGSTRVMAKNSQNVSAHVDRVTLVDPNGSTEKGTHCVNTYDREVPFPRHTRSVR